MADQEKEEPTQPVDLLTKLIDRATTAGGEGAQKSGSSLPIYLIITGIVVLGFAILGLMLVRARRRAAQLASDLRLEEEKRERAKEDLKLAKSDEERVAATQRTNELVDKINMLSTELRQLEDDREKKAQSLKSVTNWDDLVVVDRR